MSGPPDQAARGAVFHCPGTVAAHVPVADVGAQRAEGGLAVLDLVDVAHHFLVGVELRIGVDVRRGKGAQQEAVGLQGRDLHAATLPQGSEATSSHWKGLSRSPHRAWTNATR